MIRLSLLALLMTACSGGSSAPAPSADGPRDTLVIAAQSDAKDMLYVVSQSASDSHIISQTTLAPVDSDFDCSIKYKPQLAKEWSFSEDGKILKMTLRDDMKWPDGTPVTAKDIKFTFDLVADAAVASPRMESTARMVPDKRPLVIDDTHLEFHFTEAYDQTTMIAHTSLPAVPAHLLAGADRASLRGHALNATSPVANGPWKVASWEKNAKLVLEPNETYGGDKPKLRRVIFKVLPEYATRLLELENGQIDIMEAVLVADADKLAKEHPEIRLHRRGWRSMDYVAWNSVDPDAYKKAAETAPAGQKVDASAVAAHPIFGDKEVRKALAMAIDVDKLIKDLLTSEATGDVYGRPSVGTITPALCGVHNDAIQRIPYSADAARVRLGELGWTDSNGDGTLDKDGKPLRFTLMTNAGNARRGKAAIIIQANLKAIGVDAQIEQIESNTFFERLRKRDYEAALSGWSAGLFVDPSAIWGPDSEFNFTSYRNPDVAELIKKGLSTPDPEAAKPVWQELQQKIYEDQPYAFLYWMDEIVAVHSRFENTTVDILSPYRNLDQWSVPADKVKYPQ
jgi:peptide/nickel transport system substrate-binding protein